MSTRSRLVARCIPVAFAAAILAACGGGGGVSDGSKSAMGALTLGMTDAPVDMAYSVYIQFSGVELKPKAGAAFSIDFGSPKNIDLLTFQGTNRAILLDDEAVPAGEYEWMRLKVNADPNVGGDSYLMLKEDGVQCELRIPSGDQTGLKLIRGFTVGVGATTDFTIDFDLRKSIVAPPGQNLPGGNCDGQAYMLKPVLRVVDNLQVGAVSGLVDSNLVTAQCASSATPPYPGNVYLYQVVAPATDITPDDYDGIPDDPNGADPIASAMVDPATFRYTIGFVPAGNYEVAYTCDLEDVHVDADVVPTPPAVGETVDFTPAEGVPVPVTANQTATVNFPPP
jgi:hypothetical protein